MKSVKAVRRSVVADERKTQSLVKKGKIPGVPSLGAVTQDSFQNFMMNLGIGTQNPSSAAAYGFNPITRVRTLLDWMHRGSWLAGVAIDVLADDMTRAGIKIKGDMDPDDEQEVQKEAIQLGIWTKINEVIRWARLYGGCVGVMLIDGQKPNTPLRVETVGKNQFKGILVLDRWMLEPTLQDLVEDMGPNLGLPKYYHVTAQSPALNGMMIHHSRCMRMIGIKVPYWQALIENLWGISVLDRLYDRMVAYDSATAGAAQLVYKAYIRTYKIKGLRDVIAAGGDQMRGLSRYVDMMRVFQGIEGITLIDDEDTLEHYAQAAFGGLSDALVQFGQQLAGALQIPLVRLFGQAPAGLNATGESDLRMYYDGVRQQQESTMHVPVTNIYRLIAQSLGKKVPENFGIEFNPLWQLTDREKADIGNIHTSTVVQAQESGIIDTPTAMKELKQSSETTGIFSNITDDMIDEAEEAAEEPPDASLLLPEGVQPNGGVPKPGKAAPGVGGATPHAKTATAGSKGWVQPISKAKGGIGRAVAGDQNYPQLEQADVDFERMAAGKDKCVDCRFYNAPMRCYLVAGVIHTESWCKLWQRRTGPRPAVGAGAPTGDNAFSSHAAQAAFFHDLPIVIENSRGSVRSNGEWWTHMPEDYGYIRRVEGADGDALDCYVGPNPESTKVFLIDQKDWKTGDYDETKVMLGYTTEEDARRAYELGYQDGTGAQRIMKLSEATMKEFKRWMTSGDTTQPYGRVQ